MTDDVFSILEPVLYLCLCIKTFSTTVSVCSFWTCQETKSTTRANWSQPNYTTELGGECLERDVFRLNFDDILTEIS